MCVNGPKQVAQIVKSAAAADVLVEKHAAPDAFGQLVATLRPRIKPPVSAGAKRGHGQPVPGAALCGGDPSLAAVATPWRDVGCVVGVEKAVASALIVPLK